MTPDIYKWVSIHRPMYAGKILEIGSFNVNGGVKDIFTDAEQYIGIDIAQGPGVDMVMSGHDAKYFFEPNGFDTIICLETIEHDKKFWLTMESIGELLAPNGYLILSSPTYGFPYHYPPDYYRFSKEAIEFLATMNNRKIIQIDRLEDPNGDPCHIVISHHIESNKTID